MIKIVRVYRVALIYVLSGLDPDLEHLIVVELDSPEHQSTRCSNYNKDTEHDGYGGIPYERADGIWCHDKTSDNLA